MYMDNEGSVAVAPSGHAMAEIDVRNSKAVTLNLFQGLFLPAHRLTRSTMDAENEFSMTVLDGVSLSHMTGDSGVGLRSNRGPR